jgi:hypothetical protein
MLQIPVVVDRLNLEMLLSHEARITRIKREQKKKTPKINISKEETEEEKYLNKHI